LKIHKLECRNINSLHGTISIDFASLQEDGMFLISGPTGAGKSSIFDAICLALFGKTPRLGTKTVERAGVDDVVHFSESDAFARLYFQMEEQEYISEWQIRRKQRKRDEFYSPKMNLYKNDECIAEGSKEVQAAIEKESGLDFNRFTKSILLAQGEFQAFLKSNRDDRALLLERLAGGELYRTISIHVFEKEKQVKNELEITQQAFDQLEGLDESELQRLNDALDSLQKNKVKLQQRLMGLQSQLNQSRTYKEINQRFEQVQAEFRQLLIQDEAMLKLSRQVELNQKSGELYHLYERRDELGNKMAELPGKVEQGEAELRAFIGGIQQVSDELALEECTTEELEAQLSDAKQKLTLLESRRQEISEQKAVLSGFLVERDHLEQRVEELSRSFLEAEERKHSLTNELEAMNKVIAERERCEHNARQELEVQTRLRSLQEGGSLEQLEAIFQGYREVLRIEVREELIQELSIVFESDPQVLEMLSQLKKSAESESPMSKYHEKELLESLLAAKSEDLEGRLRDALLSQREDLKKELALFIHDYSFDEFSLDEFESWQELQSYMIKLVGAQDLACAGLKEIDIPGLQEDIAAYRKQLEEKTSRVESLRGEINGFDTSGYDESRKAIEKLEVRMKQQNELMNQREKLQLQLDAQGKIQEEYKNQLQELQRNSARNAEAIEQAEKIYGSIDRTELLSPEELQEKRALIEEYFQKKQSTETRLSDLEEQKADFPADLVQEERILSLIDQAEKEREALVVQEGGILERLRRNQSDREKQAKIHDELKALKQEYGYLEILNNLIGSRDGKKYVRYVQNLSMGLLIQYANQHLKNLVPRYALKLKDQLQFDVIDQWQLDEVRHPDNLSGGEQFMLSLSLSLALSDLMGKRLGTLFLDEGFGTLDEDSLETVLSCLENLQSQGRIIGIISHVAFLRERIVKQLQIEPVGAGRSRVKTLAFH
jgi:exonuclease SbcC